LQIFARRFGVAHGKGQPHTGPYLVRNQKAAPHRIDALHRANQELGPRDGALAALERRLAGRRLLMRRRGQRHEHERLIHQVLCHGAQHLERRRALDLEHHRAARLRDDLEWHQ
jgi:hypothetical protein